MSSQPTTTKPSTGIWPTQEDTAKVNYVLGGFNKIPDGYEVINESEYYWRWNIKPAKSIYQYRQVVIDDRYKDCSLFVHPGDYSGIGFYLEYDGRATRVEIDAYKPIYFKWKVCEHEFETMHSGNCYWEGKCTKCDYVKAVDSSG